jgi:heme exporter protein D
MKITEKFKVLTVVAIAMLFAQNTNAQETTATENKATNYDQGFRLGFGLNGGYVFDDPYELAIGGDVRLQYDLNKRYSLTLTTGYNHFFVDGKNFDGSSNDLGFIPAKAGFKAFFWEDQFYAMGEAGAVVRSAMMISFVFMCNCFFLSLLFRDYFKNMLLSSSFRNLKEV